MASACQAKKERCWLDRKIKQNKRQNKKMAKIKVGFFSFTCCEGCTMVFIEILNKKYEEYMKKMSIENFRQLKKQDKMKKMDIAFVEGAISTQSEEKKLKEIRKNTKTLIALGSGAVNGYPSNQRNKFDKNKQKQIASLIEKFHQNKTIEPLNKFVKVDDEINGCPVSEEDLVKKIDNYLK
jgi:sulfhydrogenase subunit delta